MNKFSMRSIPAAVALTAVMTFVAHAQMGGGVRDGVNSNIGNDVRTNANTSVTAGMGTGASVSSHTPTRVQANDGAVTRAAKRTGNAVQRTGNRVGVAADKAAGATRSGAYRAKNAVSNTAARADRGIQNNLPGSRNAGPAAEVGVQGSGNVSGQIARPPQ